MAARHADWLFHVGPAAVLQDGPLLYAAEIAHDVPLAAALHVADGAFAAGCYFGGS
jgi:hypothetical protein